MGQRRNPSRTSSGLVVLTDSLQSGTRILNRRTYRLTRNGQVHCDPRFELQERTNLNGCRAFDVSAPSLSQYRARETLKVQPRHRCKRRKNPRPRSRGGLQRLSRFETYYMNWPVTAARSHFSASDATLPATPYVENAQLPICQKTSPRFSTCHPRHFGQRVERQRLEGWRKKSWCKLPREPIGRLPRLKF